MNTIGEENVFVLCMDGSCAKTLQLFNEKYPNKFGQRCATQAALLLYFDIGRDYVEEIVIAKDILKFIINHEYVLELYRNTGAVSLYELAGTRFVNVVYSAEIVVKEKEKIELLWATPALLLWIENQTADIKLEFLRLREKLILSEKMWQNLNFYVKLQRPLRLFVQITDGKDPTLHLIAYEFNKAKIDTLAVVKEAYQNEQLVADLNTKKSVNINKYTDLDKIITQKFNEHENDCVSDLAIAAYMFTPHYLYDPIYSDFKLHKGDIVARKLIEKYFCSDTKNSDDKVIIEDLILKIKGNYRSYRECIAGTFFAKSEIIRSGKIYNNGNTWWSEVSNEYPELALLGRKLMNAYGGKGNIKNWNENNFLSENTLNIRNFSSQEKIDAYFKIKSSYRFQNGIANEKPLHEILQKEIAFFTEGNHSRSFPDSSSAVAAAAADILKMVGEGNIKKKTQTQIQTQIQNQIEIEEDDYDKIEEDPESSFLINHLFAKEILEFKQRFQK